MNRIEEEIRKAQARGEFENLRGTGQPLQPQDENPFNAELRMAHKSLKEAGYTLPFIENRHRILGEIEAARSILSKAAAINNGTAWAKLRGDKSKIDFRQKVPQINKQIQIYNLKAPNTHFHLLPLDAEREIEVASERADS